MLKDLDDVAPAKEGDELRVVDFERRHLAGIHELNRKRDEPDADRYFEESVGEGYHGFAAFVGEELVGYYWWVDRDNPVTHPDLWRMGRGFALAAGDVFGCSLYLLPEYRGGGRAGRFLHQVESSLRDRGYRRLWGWVETSNRPARWIYAVRGYEPKWQVRVRRFVVLAWRHSSPLVHGLG